MGSRPDTRDLDFWARRAGDKELVVLERGTSEKLPPEIDGVALRVVKCAELAAAAMWIANWQRMLPVLGADLEISRRSANPVSHPERIHCQSRRIVNRNLSGSLESRQIPRKWLNPASASTMPASKVRAR